jgi:hypothetical protein
MLNSLASQNIGVDFWYVGMGGASLVDYYLKYCIKGRDSKITLSGSYVLDFIILLLGV